MANIRRVEDAMRYALIRTLRTWLWLIVAVAALAGGVIAFLAVFDAVDDDRYAVAAASGAAVAGAILVATPYLVVIALLSLILEITEGVTWITRYLYDRVEGAEESP